MATINESDLSAMLLKDTTLRQVESDIYSVLPVNETGSEYDTRFGYIYDWVACNPIYNHLIWGYSVKIFARIAHDALRSSTQGRILDLGCGSLAFTAKTYAQYSERPIVLADQSLTMLRIAKSRLARRTGRVPDNMIFLHADALRLPFQKRIFQTIISENLLHCLDDTRNFLIELKDIITGDGKMYFTTLVKNNRLADRYLEALAKGGKLISRTVKDHQAVFDQLDMSVKYETKATPSSTVIDIYDRFLTRNRMK
jgi:ubiquinone/menaquinone biosynthesis C-methylase UbiE